MSIQPIDTQTSLLQAMQGMQNSMQVQPNPNVSAGESSVDFSEAFQSAMKSIDNRQHLSSAKAAAVESGRSDDLVGTMIASQKASLSFEMLVQTRNRLMTAFEKISSMPV